MLSPLIPFLPFSLCLLYYFFFLPRPAFLALWSMRKTLVPDSMTSRSSHIEQLPKCQFQIPKKRISLACLGSGVTVGPISCLQGQVSPSQHGRQGPISVLSRIRCEARRQSQSKEISWEWDRYPGSMSYKYKHNHRPHTHTHTHTHTQIHTHTQSIQMFAVFKN